MGLACSCLIIRLYSINPCFLQSEEYVNDICIKDANFIKTKVDIVIEKVVKRGLK